LLVSFCHSKLQHATKIPATVTVLEITRVTSLEFN